MTNSLRAFLGLLVLVACLPDWSQTRQILNCTRTSSDYFPGTNTQYKSLQGIRLSTDNVLLTRWSQTNPAWAGQVVDDHMNNLTSLFSVPNTSHQLVAGPNGEFGILWSENNQILLQPYTASGQTIGSALVVAQSTVNLPFSSLQLQDTNKVVVAWQDSNASTIYARVYNQWVAGDAVALAPTSLPFQMRSLTSGGFVISWFDNSVLRIRTFDSDAQALSAPVIVSQTVNFYSVEPLAGGRFVVGWGSNSDLTNSTQGNYIYGRVFNRKGAATSSPFLIRTRYDAGYYDDNNNFVLNPIASLSFVSFPSIGGRFLALWVETEGVNYNTQTVLYARSFFLTGASNMPKELPILYHVLDYKAIGLENGGWVLYGVYGSSYYQNIKDFVLKAFASINDFEGFETYPIGTGAASNRRYPSYIYPSTLFETTSDSQSSDLVAIWSFSSGFTTTGEAFGLQCTLAEYTCYDTLGSTSAEQLENTGIVAQDQTDPSIAASPGISFTHTAVWQSTSASGGGNIDIAGRYTEWGQVQLNSGPPRLNINPSLSMINSNTYLAVWSRLHNGTDGSDWDIIGRVAYESLGYGSESMVNEKTALNQVNASVACASAAATRCLVVWLGEEASGSYGVYARFQQNVLDPYDPVHYTFGEFRVNTDAGNHKNPKVTFLGDGIRYVITWEYQSPGSNTWIVKYKVSDYFASLTPVAVLPGPDLKASTATTGNEFSPVVTSYLKANRFVIAWKAQQGNRIVARLFDLDGPTGREFVVARVPSGEWGYPALTPFYVGWAVAWQAQDGLWMKAYDGRQEQALIQMNDTPVGDQPAVPSIAGKAFYNTIKSVWQSNQVDGSGYGIVYRTLGCSA